MSKAEEPDTDYKRAPRANDPIYDEVTPYEGESINSERLSSKWWRMNNLYKIVDKDGKIVPFKFNPPQDRLFRNLWYKNIILKARQQGFTIFTCIYFLDECLFNDSCEAGIIAHTKTDASDIFRRKIQFPYNNLPEDLKKLKPLVTDSQVKMGFDNDSIISVGTSMRSGTLQYLLISELGKIAKKYPEKAREIMTGALETVGLGENIIFVESTGEGRSGVYFSLCDTAQKKVERSETLTKMDFRFNFFAWFDDPTYILNEPVPITKDMAKYFNDMVLDVRADKQRNDPKFSISIPQKQWYIKKHESLGDDVKREYPSTADEAFESGIVGTYYKTQFRILRAKGQITKVPHVDGVNVDIWMDLGMDDSTTLWFTQDVGREIHVLNYYENSGEGLEFYRDKMDEYRRKYGYRYGRIVAPHDIKVRELGTGVSRLATAHRLGMEMEVGPKVEAKMDGIQKVRSILSICWFDAENCDSGLTHLEEYRKQWDEINGVFRDTPLHNEHCHGADGFETFAVSHDFKVLRNARPRARAKTVQRRSSKGWG